MVFFKYKFLLKRKIAIRYSRRWGRPATTLVLSCLLLLFLVIPVLSGDSSLTGVYGWTDWQAKSPESILADTLPGCEEGIWDDLGWERFLYDFVTAVTGVSSGNPTFILGNELNLTLSRTAIGYMPASSKVIEEEGGEEDFYLPGQDESLDDWIVPQPDEFPPVQLHGEPMVLVYNTHNAESYKPSDGTARLEGKNGGVAAVSKMLAQALESKHGIKTVNCDVIHDYPDWTKSYINSMRSVQQLLKKHSAVQMVIDIHRDAGLNTRTDTLVKIGNKNYAKVMIVVGTEHPNWQKNLGFAQKIEATANRMYPGLIKCTRVLKDRRYNQHLHPRALLFEFGSDLNTREDALNSAVVMGEIIAAALKG